MSRLFPRSTRAAIAIAAIPLAFCSLAPWFARVDGASAPAVGVVDAFLNARAARDDSGVVALLDEDAEIVDSDGFRASRNQGLYQALRLGDTIEFGPRSQGPGGEVMWTETVVQDGRPSWENNLNWWMDGNPAIGMQASTAGIGGAPQVSQPRTRASGPAPARDTRYARANVTEGRITRLTMTWDARPEAGISSSSGAWARMLALVATLALLGCALIATVTSEPAARPVSERGRLVQGLKCWLAVRQGQGPC